LKIGIETSCLKQTVRGVGTYTQALLETLKNLDIHLFKRSVPNIPLTGSLESLFKRYQGVDLIHFPEPKILYGIRPRAPFVITIHDLMPLKFPEYFPRKHTWMMRYFIPRYLKAARQVICVSEATRSDLTKFLPSIKPIVIPCGIPSRKRDPNRKRDPFFLYIGSFEKRKNLKRILEAFHILKRKGIPHHLFIAGKSQGSNKLPYKLPPDVKALGYVNEEKKQDLLERATALIWPSLYEGFGIPLQEAMASGLPVITSDRGACPETVGDAGLIINPESVVEIAYAMEKVATDISLQKSFRTKGLRRAETFSLPCIRKQLIEVYNSVRCADIHAV
jgi:glycosyltransferase involved in cell wall biosynthesis